VKVSQLRNTLHDCFTVKAKQYAEYAVGCWVLWTHVENHVVLKRILKHYNRVFVLHFTQDFALTELLNAFNRRRIRYRYTHDGIVVCW
jgi:hypothetical protein